MTKQEIQALIDAKIAGQGSAVDAGGALPTILKAVLDLIPSGPVEIPIASAEVLGGVKVGQNLSVEEDGTLNAQGGGGITPIIIDEVDIQVDEDNYSESVGIVQNFDELVAAFKAGTPIVITSKDYSALVTGYDDETITDADTGDTVPSLCAPLGVVIEGVNPARFIGAQE